MRSCIDNIFNQKIVIKVIFMNEISPCRKSMLYILQISISYLCMFIQWLERAINKKSSYHNEKILFVFELIKNSNMTQHIS